MINQPNLLRPGYPPWTQGLTKKRLRKDVACPAAGSWLIVDLDEQNAFARSP
jgi:hypothetical protein